MTGTGNNRVDNVGENPGEMSGAYALHALNPGEAAGYEAHLAESEQARIEAAELSDTAVALGLATAPVQPSAALKASLMARLATTPQLPPLRAPTVAPAVVRAVPVPPDVVEPAAERPAEASAGPVTPVAASSGGTASERARRRWFRGPVSMLVAAAAAVALFVGGAFAGQAFNSDQFPQQQAAGLAQINSAPDSKRASTTTSDGHKATLVWSTERKLSALLVDDLPELPSDKDYQLWYIGGTGAVSAGTFDSSGTGTVWRVLDGSITVGDLIGVTVEPKGGSKQPTTDPIVAIQSS
ncbi:anti-sigma factor [Cryobacterium algoritolerans]|nr:anti-sigma factor [Cryobacterium algoritolerans]